MPDTCISKFKVAVEVANFICYVKYINKGEQNTVNKITNALYKQINNNQNVSKDDIADIINLYRNQLSPSMLKEDKFSLPYNPINDKYLTNSENISDTYDAQFIIKTNTNIENRFSKNNFMNSITDNNQGTLFLLDIRYYGMETKYYEVDFELHLSEKEIYIKSSDEKLVDKFFEQYDLQQVCDILGIIKEIDYNHYLEQSDILKENLNEIYSFNNSTLLEQLVDSYEVGNCVFLNNVFLNKVDIDFKALIKPLEKPKLVVVLEKQDYNYFSNSNNKINRIENIDNNLIVYIDENLFREAIGNRGYLLIMNDFHKVTLNKLDKEYANIVYLAKMDNKDLNIFKNILEKYFDIKNMSSYIDNLSLLAFVLTEEEINSNLNYYLVNELKSNSSILRFNLETREQMPYSELKKLINIYYLAKDLGKVMTITTSNIKLLLSDMLNMIKQINNIEKVNEFKIVVDEVLKIFNVDVVAFEKEINKILTLLNIKKAMVEKEKSISFILDTSALMDEPDVFHKYFNNNSIIVHSIIKDELEYFRGNNINAVRAMRNINYLKNNPKSQFEYIVGEKSETEFTKLYKVKIFEDLIERLNNEGRYPVIVSNDNELVLYEKKKRNVIELNHIPLLFH